MKRPRLFLIGTVVLIFAALALSIVRGDRPVLGIDLQGGMSVVLEPVGESSTDSLDVAVDIIRSRVDAIGVVEPEINRQGNRIIVDLPGVDDSEQAAALVGQTAELRFRPVIGCLPAAADTAEDTADDTGDGATDDTTTTTTTTTVAPEGGEPPPAEDPGAIPTTDREDDIVDQPVILEGVEPCQGDALPRYQLGPTAGCEQGVDQCVTGTVVDTAGSEFISGQGYVVTVDFTGDGSDAFGSLVAAPNVGQRVAIVLDGVVQSAPTINPGIESSPPSVQITGDFSQGEADELATILRFGALPVVLETINVQDISPTLGSDQLRAGVAAGIVGLLLIALYMFLYYRVLALVVIAGLTLGGIAVYTLVAYLGQTVGMSLTLPAITGLIVAVGVTVDSYVIYFERLKDELRTGKTLPTAMRIGFQRSFSTILAGDLIALMGSAILYWLAIGSVRGFAFFLGLSTLIDLLITYFFMHPMAMELARSKRLIRMRWFGIGSALDQPELER